MKNDKEKKMLDIIGDIDDELIERSKPSGIRKSRVIWTSIISSAALLALVFGLQYRFIAKPLMDGKNNESAVSNQTAAEYTDDGSVSEKSEIGYLNTGIKGQGNAYPFDAYNGKVYSNVTDQNGVLTLLVKVDGLDSYYVSGLPINKEDFSAADDIPYGRNEQIFSDEDYIAVRLNEKLALVNRDTSDVKIWAGVLNTDTEHELNDRIIGMDISHNIYVLASEYIGDNLSRKIIKLDTELNTVSEFDMGTYSEDEPTSVFDRIGTFSSLSTEGSIILIECINGETVRYDIRTEEFVFSEEEDILNSYIEYLSGHFDRKVDAEIDDPHTYYCDSIIFHVKDENGEDTILEVYDNHEPGSGDKLHYCVALGDISYSTSAMNSSITVSDENGSTAVPLEKSSGSEVFMVSDGDILVAECAGTGFIEFTRYSYGTWKNAGSVIPGKLPCDSSLADDHISVFSVAEDSEGTLYFAVRFEDHRHSAVYKFPKNGPVSLLTDIPDSSYEDCTTTPQKIAVIPDNNRLICSFPAQDCPVYRDYVFAYIDKSTGEMTPLRNDECDMLKSWNPDVLSVSLQGDGTVVYIEDSVLYELDLVNMEKKMITECPSSEEYSIENIIKDGDTYYFDSQPSDDDSDICIRYIKK